MSRSILQVLEETLRSAPEVAEVKQGVDSSGRTALIVDMTDGRVHLVIVRTTTMPQRPADPAEEAGGG